MPFGLQDLLRSWRRSAAQASHGLTAASAAIAWRYRNWVRRQIAAGDVIIDGITMSGIRHPWCLSGHQGVHAVAVVGTVLPVGLMLQRSRVPAALTTSRDEQGWRPGLYITAVVGWL